MQVEMIDTTVDWSDYMNPDVYEKSIYKKAEEFDQEKLETYLADPQVKEVHVFSATPKNMLFAELRERYPDSTRRELRKMMKHIKRNK